MRAIVQFEELRETEVDGPRANHEDRAVGFRGNAIEIVYGAGGGFEERCRGSKELYEGKELEGGKYAAFCEAAVHYATGQSTSYSQTANSLQRVNRFNSQ